MITATCVLLTIAEAVTLVVFTLSDKTTCFSLWVLNSAANHDLTLPTWLASAMALALYSLPAKPPLNLLRHNNMMLLVHDWWLHVNILELSVLRTRTFPREELLLVSVSSLLNFTSFWGWTLWFCKVLSSLERFRSMGGLDFNFIRMAFLMMSDWVLLLLKKHRLLLLSHQELLLVVGTVLALPQLLVFQTQTKAIAARHLGLTAMHWT